MDVNIGSKITRKRHELRDCNIEKLFVYSCLPFGAIKCNIQFVNPVNRWSPLVHTTYYATALLTKMLLLSGFLPSPIAQSVS